MADLAKFNINGEDYTVKDTTARETADAAASAEEYDRQESIGQFAGRSLESIFADEIATKANVYEWLHSRIQAGNFSGLRIGDYMDVPITAGTNVPAQTVRYMIAAIDPYYQCSDQPLGHHIAFVPNAPVLVGGTKATNGSNIMWNTTATNNGNANTKEPYLISHLHGWELSDWLPALPSALQAVLINYRSLIPQRYGSTAQTEDTSWAWGDLGKVWSLSETEVYGQLAWASKNGYAVGMDCHFPLFSTSARRLMGSRVSWWLRSVVGGSSSSVCYVSGIGYANYYSATYTSVRPRPCFLIG